MSVPHNVWVAAKTLYDYMPSLRDHVGLIVEEKSDLVIKNPYVKIYHVLDTGACSIYLSEVIPLSMYLFLLLKEASYHIQIIPNSKYIEVEFAQVYVKPFHGKEKTTQRFHCDEIIQQYDANEYQQATAYVEHLGELNPDEVVQPSFIDFHVEGLRVHGKRARVADSY